jgi:hypothetical protein
MTSLNFFALFLESSSSHASKGGVGGEVLCRRRVISKTLGMRKLADNVSVPGRRPRARNIFDKKLGVEAVH